MESRGWSGAFLSRRHGRRHRNEGNYNRVLGALGVHQTKTGEVVALRSHLHIYFAIHLVFIELTPG